MIPLLPLVLTALTAPFQTPEHAAPAPAGPDTAPQSARDLTAREIRLLETFAIPVAPLASPTNRWADSPEAAALGARLFFEPGLSGSGDLSCASCHKPELGWADGLRVAEGAETGAHNTPSVINTGAGLWQFWDGRADSLWSQALAPIENHLEMAGSRVGAVRFVLETERLRTLYEAAFGTVDKPFLSMDLPEVARPAPIDPRNPFAGPTQEDLLDPAVQAWELLSKEDQAAINLVYSRLGKAIEAYERTLISRPAPFDLLGEALRSGGTEGLNALEPDALYGWRLFIGKSNCISCHFGPNFSDGRFHNLGLPLQEGQQAEEGRPNGIRRMRVDPMNGRGAMSDDASWGGNQKLLYVASSEHVIGALKTPSLRDVERTAPYSHDGRFQSLEEVLDFYSELPGEAAIGHREETLEPLHLSGEEKSALLAFLRSLTGAPVPPPSFVLSEG